jgi:hypothetical protein
VRARRIALSALAMCACATDTVVGDEVRAMSGVEIAPYEFHEECATLAAGERIDYRFQARPPVHFEIYYQDGLARVAPINRDDTTADSGIYPAQRAQRFCLRWDVGRQGAILELRVRVLRAGK